MSSKRCGGGSIGTTAVLPRLGFLLLAIFSCGTTAAQEKAGSISASATVEFDRKKFDRSVIIDNKWFPLQPGTQSIFVGATQEGSRRIPHRVVWTVTDLTKVVDGVRGLVVWEVDYSAGKVQESELAFFAQDGDGNVWHLGQYPEEYEGRKIVNTPVWLAGIEGAKAGLSMKAAPKLGSSDYSQGFGPAVNWTDRGKVDQVGVRVCVRAGCYDDVLVIAESSEEEGPNAQQLKYYAPGVGLVRVDWRGAEEKTRETLELVEIVKLDAAATARMRKLAQEVDKRAYNFSKKVYGQTEPATPLVEAESR